MLLIQLLVVQIYFFSAIGKLERTGLSWGSAEHMQLWLLRFNQDSQSVVFGTLGPWIAQFGWLTGAIGAATVLFEWCMPQAMNIHVPEAWLILVLVDWPGSASVPTPASWKDRGVSRNVHAGIDLESVGPGREAAQRSLQSQKGAALPA